MQRPLTGRQRECLLMAEPTLYGETKAVEPDGRTIRGLKIRGLVDGDMPHIYLTPEGKAHLDQLGSQ